MILFINQFDNNVTSVIMTDRLLSCTRVTANELNSDYTPYKVQVQVYNCQLCTYNIVMEPNRSQ